MANQCRKAGYTDVETEFPLFVSYKDFCKEYYVDLLVQDSIIYELKAVSKLNPEHDKQTLNYLFLLGLLYGKLINFRPLSVQKRFVSTTLLREDRYDINFNDSQWLKLDEESIWLKELIIELLLDWGAYLETSLFYEAIHHFRGGKECVIKNIDVILNGTKLGKQKIHLLNKNIAFKLTSIRKDIESYEQHLSRFIHLRNLEALQWINFNHSAISFKTILNQKK